jgi:putative intracellular protease/amidase
MSRDADNEFVMLEATIVRALARDNQDEPPGVLRHLKTPDGKPVVQGKKVTGFTDGEEKDVGLTNVVPFLVEDELINLGATFSKVKNWGVHTVTDGQLITGQNPASSGPAAKVLRLGSKPVLPCAVTFCKRSKAD